MSVMALSQKKIKKTKIWLISGLLLVLLALVAYTFLYLKHDATMTDVGNRLASPSWEHPMGTDHLGRDVLTRLLLGFRLTVGYSMIALAAAVIIGVPFGLLAGLRGGWLDRVFMRIADGFLAFPDTVIAIVLSGLLGPGIGNLLFAIVLVKWVNYARMVRSTVLTEVQKDYITIARINGLSTFTIMRKHLLPHIIGNVLVLASLDFGKIILLISSLSYIGLGAQPPTPEWGAMLNESRPYFQGNPEMMVYPGLAIVAVVLVANVLGDYLRDKFDVKKEVQP
ncbi:nickel ABC transporter permease subunit NikC [Terribacillus saccharophilus]|jgi:peptide/nickel transport system permease protein|uniref:Nickel ABC transporter permease subunit NikC n=2 Tax=Bacillaceae TaxID=186817 RepID=A0A268HAA4_9BACI|nr:MULTISPECIES: nickel transporter permease [Terribacillus]PAD34658.1 nickel ABC transporter permease subunit NikC [Terribacillus saccharophilus]PAD95406.1 nickel ABC transporter permease subunit NikC [Terribacillus saccharophilus]PAD98984.1 nickel ABC transporter permease subunit NikC [Terribacillus saccharophilus]PAE06802.1 nickel ABC transporter permease subunit NikC [Terribacillus saccharophilus]VVM33970.1 Dipeptide transport system permease protein DppC (TC 3.A.1.5.2) [Terribacillus sp. 